MAQSARLPLRGKAAPIRFEEGPSQSPLASGSPPPRLPPSSRASPSGPSREPFERLLDHQQHSVTTFLSSVPSEGFLDGLRNSSSWSEDMPQAILFPANKPSSRADAMILDQWISSAFTNYAQRSLPDKAEDEDLSRAVEELVPILSIGLHEVVRQVTQHCLERGVVLEKIWRTYVDLFERSLAGTRRSLRRHKERTARVERELDRTKRELDDLRRKHPLQIERLSGTLQGKFTQRQEDLQEQLSHMNLENDKHMQELRLLTGNVTAWFPNFDLYKASSYKRTLDRTPPEAATYDTPEGQLSADFMRVLGALPAESRRRVGYYISSLLGLRSARMTPDSVEALTECRDHNAWKIEQLEARVQELKGHGSSKTADPG
mmetsp:Transcript_151652/g.486610  ORF Transcript_151652/g.486610 Transcript_151652/m.486610 type:complete len:376 (+) Transcript_151652:104-1231(+)